MNAVEIHDKQLLLWHKSCHQHPIFNPKYAQENLVALAESFTLFLLYLDITVLSLHFLVLNGFLEVETLTWFLVESSARRLMFWASSDEFLNKIDVLLVLGLALVFLSLIRHLFNIAKANYHPNSKRDLSRFLAKNNLGNLMIKDSQSADSNIKLTEGVLNQKSV